MAPAPLTRSLHKRPIEPRWSRDPICAASTASLAPSLQKRDLQLMERQAGNLELAAVAGLTHEIRGSIET